MNLKPIASNMTEVTTNDCTILFSYSTPVACLINGKTGDQSAKCGFYRTEKRWSVTTSKHINKWLNGAIAETRPQSFFDSLV